MPAAVACGTEDESFAETPLIKLLSGPIKLQKFNRWLPPEAAPLFTFGSSCVRPPMSDQMGFELATALSAVLPAPE